MTIDLFNFSFPVVGSALFFILIQGATGEEPGWGGYLLPAIAKRVGEVKSSLAVSVIWSLWHAPIWFLGTSPFVTSSLCAKFQVIPVNMVITLNNNQFHTNFQ